MDSTKIVLSILEETYIIHKLDQSTNLPEELIECEFYSLSNSQEELSLVSVRSKCQFKVRTAAQTGNA